MDREKLQALAATLPSKTFYGSGSEPFMTRYILCKLPDGRQVNLHHFHRSDEDPELHNHPWPGRSLILAGGYAEERLVDGQVRRFIYLPGATNRIEPNTFHRVELLTPVEGCWTLFTLGRKEQEWGFWNRETKVYKPWREFIESKGLIPYD